MSLSIPRRQVLVLTGLGLVSCVGPRRRTLAAASPALDELLAAHADVLPEIEGVGANHYPMAAEALEALGHAEAIDRAWITGAAGYAGRAPRAGPLVADASDGPSPTTDAALGDPRRLGDWLDLFRVACMRRPWQDVVARWVPHLAPGLSAAAFHGLIRSAHAVRALRRLDGPARRAELAAGLAYWAAHHTELPTAAGEPVTVEGLERTLTRLEHPWLDDPTDVGFSQVLDRLVARPLAPPRPVAERSDTPAEQLATLVDVTTAAFLEMLVAERHRIWLLHTVTGPAAVGLLLPHVDEVGGRRLVDQALRAVVAMYAAYGEPYTPREHLRPDPPAWPELIERAVASRSVHTIKLIEALVRFDRGVDTLHRSAAVQYLEWL